MVEYVVCIPVLDVQIRSGWLTRRASMLFLRESPSASVNLPDSTRAFVVQLIGG